MKNLKSGDRVKVRIEVPTTVREVNNRGIIVEIPHMGRNRYLDDGIVSLIEVIEKNQR